MESVPIYEAGSPRIHRWGLFIKAIQGAMEEDMPTPRDEMGKRRLLRWLMNIRMPDEVVRVQDEYLAEPGQVHLHRR